MRLDSGNSSSPADSRAYPSNTALLLHEDVTDKGSKDSTLIQLSYTRWKPAENRASVCLFYKAMDAELRRFNLIHVDRDSGKL